MDSILAGAIDVVVADALMPYLSWAILVRRSVGAVDGVERLA